MSIKDNKAFISRYLDALSGKEKPAAVVDQFVCWADAALKEHIAGFEAAFPRYALNREDMIAETDKVVVRFTFSATYVRGFMNIPAKGQKVAIPGIIIYRIAGGKIVEHWMQVDSTALMQQLGAQCDSRSATRQCSSCSSAIASLVVADNLAWLKQLGVTAMWSKSHGEQVLERRPTCQRISSSAPPEGLAQRSAAC